MKMTPVRTWPIVLATSIVFVGCGGVSDLTKDRVARSETAVRQAQQNVGNAEQGALELHQDGVV